MRRGCEHSHKINFNIRFGFRDGNMTYPPESVNTAPLQHTLDHPPHLLPTVYYRMTIKTPNNFFGFEDPVNLVF